MNNKVIIDLDDYLSLKNRLEYLENKIRDLQNEIEINEDNGVTIEPWGGKHPFFKRDLVVLEKVLLDFLNDVLDINCYDLKIIKGVKVD